MPGLGSNRGAWAARGLLRRNDQLAVDLGTANTVVFRRGEGVVLFEPSVVAIDERTDRIHAVGTDARRMIGRTPAQIRATRPLRHGVIADFEMTEEMLRYFIGKVAGRRSRAHVIVCVPSGITEVEKNAVVEATLGAGARRAPAAPGARPPESNGTPVVSVPDDAAGTDLSGKAYDKALRKLHVELVKLQVKKLRETGSPEVAFRVAVKDGKVSFTARALKGVSD